MNIKLNTIHIHHFRSIDDITLTLNDQGTVIVKGENYYEDKAVSNGSGKSSIFEGIIFSIYEETSSGEKDVANRVYNDGYKLTLDFNIDSNHYIIIREQKGSKSTVLLYKNEVDISARNKTDTNKLILDIFKVNKALFLDSIFLSQNISTSLTSLSPTARKERLEILTNTDTNISLFKENMKAVQTKYENNANDIQLRIKQLEGKLSAMQQQNQELSLKIDHINQVNEENKVGELEQPVTVSKSETEEVVPTVEQNVVSENNNNEIQVGKPIEVAPVVESQPVVETISNAEPLNESIPQPVVTSEPVVENVVPTVEQNVVVENTTTNEVPVEIVPSVETIKDETVKPVTVNEQVAENVVSTVEQNVQQSVNNNM